MNNKPKNNFTGFMQHIVAFEHPTLMDRITGKVSLPKGYGLHIHYHKNNGDLYSALVLVDAITEEPLVDGHYDIKTTSDTMLVIVNRTIQ